MSVIHRPDCSAPHDSPHERPMIQTVPLRYWHEVQIREDLSESTDARIQRLAFNARPNADGNGHPQHALNRVGFHGLFFGKWICEQFIRRRGMRRTGKAADERPLGAEKGRYFTSTKRADALRRHADCCRHAIHETRDGYHGLEGRVSSRYPAGSGSI